MSTDRRTVLEDAGRWLRKQRERRGFETAGEFARTIGIDPSQLSRYERGISAVPDERAEQISEVLRMDILDVRRGLGLWVPSTNEPAEDDDEPDLETMSDDELEEYIDSISQAHGEALVERHRRKAV